jgi:hypothetical protein
MTLLFVLDAILVFGWAIFAVDMGRTLRRRPRVGDATGSGSPGARVSVIIPAHNEEKLLSRCLDSVRAQLRPVDELIVVDDESRDATPRLALERGAKVVPAGTRPPGWTGKPWAAHVGANAATGDWLLFIDADAMLAPNCVGAALAEAEAQGADLLSLIPEWRCSSNLERLVQPLFFMILSTTFSIERINDPADPHATAWGGFLLFRRTCYEALGGHTSVKNVIVEDLALATEVKRLRMRLRVLPAPELAATARPLSAARIWNDGCRAAFGLAKIHWSLPIFSAMSMFTVFVSPYVLIPLGGRFVALAVMHAIFTFSARWQMGRALAFDYRLAVLQPIAAVYIVVVMIWASVAAIMGRAVVRWGARQYKEG